MTKARSHVTLWRISGLFLSERVNHITSAPKVVGDA
jgi:hypothetical protein